MFLFIFIFLIFLFIVYIVKNEGESYSESFYNLLPEISIEPSYILENDSFAGGTGSIDNPYLIENSGQLDNIKNHLNSHFKLISDIDMKLFCEKLKWEPIGKNHYHPFTGTFDGDNFKISNLTIEINNRCKDVGLFGNAGDIKNKTLIKNVILVNLTVHSSDSCGGGLVGNNYGLIKNCEVRDGNISGNNLTGGLVSNSYGNIINCKFSGTVNGYGYSDITGGLIGKASQDINIKDCYVNGEIHGGNIVGGLIGNNYGLIENCEVNGEIFGSGESTGGLVSNTYWDIINCKFSGTVNGYGYRNTTGGLIGKAYRDIYIKDCFVDGKIRGTNDVGGLIGKTDKDVTVKGCYVDGNINGEDYVGGLIGNNNGIISNCFSKCKIKSVMRDVGLFLEYKHIPYPQGGAGGLIGINDGIISECFTKCKINGEVKVGGLVGINIKVIKDCFSNGKVSGISFVGGLVGLNSSDNLDSHEDSVIDCYTSVKVSGKEQIGELVGKTDKSVKSSYYIRNFNYIEDYLDIDNLGDSYKKIKKSIKTQI